MAEGKVIGWFQGRSEFGPRALGCRSILGDPRNREMQAVMNLKIKFRESFRPFAPAVLREHVSDYFGMRPNEDSPYMLLVAPVNPGHRLPLDETQRSLNGIDRLRAPRSTIPAVTHVDYSARVQTVDERHGRFRALLERFEELTGCPVAVNTSFNLSWEPIVNQPSEAYRTFLSSDIDALVLEDALLLKDRQPANLKARQNGGPQGEIDPALAEAWCCPACRGDLAARDGEAACAGCGRRFARTDGIYQLFWPHDGAVGDVTEIVKAFYEEHPFPNYDEHESLRSLVAKSRGGLYAKLLGEQLPDNSDLLEVGCGTGQLSNFLGITCRSVTGTDLCLNSLRMAEGFRSRHGLSRVRFLQMNLFRPSLKPEHYDVVLCNGVLHHTSDPYGGFRSISRLLRPGGLIVIGLYNHYGRLALAARRRIFQVTGGRLQWIDPYIRSTPMSRAKRSSWFADQYQHPHESSHTMGEVLRWFSENGFEFVHSVPSTNAWDAFDDDEKLFAPIAAGTSFDRGLAQAKLIFTGSREGGFFIMIGRKRGES